MTVAGIAEIKEDFIKAYESLEDAENNGEENGALVMDLREDMEFLGGMLYQSLSSEEREVVKTWGDLCEYAQK